MSLCIRDIGTKGCNGHTRRDILPTEILAVLLTRDHSTFSRGGRVVGPAVIANREYRFGSQTQHIFVGTKGIFLFNGSPNSHT